MLGFTPDRRRLFREIWTLAWPIAGSNFLSRAASIVDTAMIGRVSATALAGMGIAQVPVFVAMAVQRGLGIGGQVLIAYHTGAREPERRLKVARAVVAICALVSIGLGLLLWPLSPWMCRFMGAQGETLQHALSYLRIYYLALVFSGTFFVFSAIFQGAGDSRTPLVVTLGVNLLHVLIAYTAIFGKFGAPKLGVMGASLGLGISEGAGAIALAAIAYRRGLWNPDIKGLSLRAAKAIWGLGSPTAAERLIVNTMQGFYYRFLTDFGPAAIAAHRIGIDMEAVAFLPALGFGQAATTIVSQRLGAKDEKGARQAGWMTTWIAVAFMTILGLSFYLFSHQWIALFTDDPAIRVLGVKFCTVAAAIQIPLALALVLAGALRGAGETRWVMLTPVLGGWIVRLPLSYLFGYTLGFGLMGIWWSMMGDWVTRSLALALKFKTLKFRLGSRMHLPVPPAPIDTATKDLGS
jgi:putative MATE family efflux protein